MTNKRKLNSFAAAAAAAILPGIVMGTLAMDNSTYGTRGERGRILPDHPGTCLLPGCDTVAEHPGGYCCAEHCREDRQRLRSKQRLTGRKRKTKKKQA